MLISLRLNLKLSKKLFVTLIFLVLLSACGEPTVAPTSVVSNSPTFAISTTVTPTASSAAVETATATSTFPVTSAASTSVPVSPSEPTTIATPATTIASSTNTPGVPTATRAVATTVPATATTSAPKPATTASSVAKVSTVIDENSRQAPPPDVLAALDFGQYGGGPSDCKSVKKAIYLLYRYAPVECKNSVGLPVGEDTTILITGFANGANIKVSGVYEDNTSFNSEAVSTGDTTSGTNASVFITLKRPGKLNVTAVGSDGSKVQTSYIVKWANPFLVALDQDSGQNRLHYTLQYANLPVGKNTRVLLYKEFKYFSSWTVQPDAQGKFTQDLTISVKPDQNGYSGSYGIIIPSLGVSQLLTDTTSHSLPYGCSSTCNPTEKEQDIVRPGLINLKEAKSGVNRRVLFAGFKPDEKLQLTVDYDCSDNQRAQLLNLQANAEGKLDFQFQDQVKQYCQTITNETGFRLWAYGLESGRVRHAYGLIVGADSAVKLPSARLLTTLKGHSAAINVLAFSGSGKWLASGDNDGVIKLWDVESGKELSTLKGSTIAVTALGFPPYYSDFGKDRFLLSGLADGSVRVWDLQTKKDLGKLYSHGSAVTQLAFIDEYGKNILVTTSTDKTIKVWDLTMQREAGILKGHTAAVNALDVLPSMAFAGKDDATADYQSIITSGSSDNTIKIWNVDKGKLLKTLQGHKDKVNTIISLEYLSWYYEPIRLISGSADKTVKVWDIESGEAYLTLTGHTDEVTSVTLVIFQNWTVVASGGGDKDKTIKLWNLETGKELATLKGHTGGIRALISGPGQIIASGSADNTIKLWKLEG